MDSEMIQEIDRIIDAKLDPVKADISGMKGDIAELKTDMREVKGDIVVLKSDVAELKSDMRGVKDDISSIKADMARHNHIVEPQLKIIMDGIAGLLERNRQVDRLESRQEDHDNRIWALEQTVKELKQA